MCIRDSFCDVQCRGHYPAYALKMFERKGFNIDITEADKKALAEGTVCLLYTSRCV